MIEKIKKIFGNGLLFFTLPLVSLAQNTTNSDITELLSSIKSILTTAVIPFVLVLATVFFIVGIIRYIMNAGSADKQKEARSMILWSVIILVATLTIWGLVNVIVNSLDFESRTVPTPPY